jgi:uncharacterized protein
VAELQREGFKGRLRGLLRTFPAVAVLGPRQAGKSTLVREFLGPELTRGGATIFDLERPSDWDRLSSAPEQDLGALQAVRRYIALDEVQRAVHLFPLLRVLLDDPDRKARYLLLGSASPHLVRGVSESLAGRLGFLDLPPFLFAEVEEKPSPSNFVRLWERGGFPPAYFARSARMSLDWRENYLRTLVERDLPVLGLTLPAVTLRRLLTMVAHLHGGIARMTELASALSVTSPTAARYVELLEGSFIVRTLQPYFANVGKRLVKASKLYVRDSGLLHALLGLADLDAVRSHPKAGSSFEGFVVEQIEGALRLLGENPELFYWRTHGGAEVDLLVQLGTRLFPIEIKLGVPDGPLRGLTECMNDLKIKTGFVLHGGSDFYQKSAQIWALPVGLISRPRDLLAALCDPTAHRR